METANKGMTIKFAAKTASLDEDWKVAFATKKGDHFEVFFEENTEEKHIFKFEDETKSLLSANLWEMGWYSLLQDERARHDIMIVRVISAKRSLEKFQKKIVML